MYLDRIHPVTRATAWVRGLRGTSVADGNYLLDGGSERLILEWKHVMKQLLCKRDGISIEPLDGDLDDLLHKSGSASYQPKRLGRVSHHERSILSKSLAPIESDGVGDEEEWNLFEQYLTVDSNDPDSLDEPHSLSNMLDSWATAVVSDYFFLYVLFK